MFDPVDPKQSFPALEHGILSYWREEDIFKRSLHLQRKLKGGGEPGKRQDLEEFHFFDGPPFATGLPHYGHLLAGTIKDVIPRYQTMQGKRVQRRFGWDCHGLPVEYEIEKEHGITSKKEIEDMGVKAFNDLCRKAVQRYSKEWRITVERMGRFVDMDWDYRTMDPDYMESIWWVFKQLFDKKLIYEGHKPMHVCPRCQTPLSNFEVTQGYKDITDHSAYVKFRLVPEKIKDEKTKIQDENFVLAWTTTPWTLPGNLFLAINPAVEYIKVRLLDDVNINYILAKDRAEDVFKGQAYGIVEAVSAKELLGKTYEPLFPYFEKKYRDQGFKIVAGDFVTTEDGTGVVHIAPGFGEDDFAIGKREGIDPLLQHVGMDGKCIDDVTDFAGQEVKPKDDPSKMDLKIAAYLKQHGTLFREEKFKHSYPHCWRCDSPLINYATSSWFVAVEKIKNDMLDANAKTEWVPSHIRDGRFGKWLENARDWAISRTRYWGTPLPIWRSRVTGEMEVIGSRDDLMMRRPERFTKVTVLRHGESAGNVRPVYQGELPGTDLTDQGRAQAAAAGEILGSQKVTRIYASPLARTQQTASHIAETTKAPIVTDERIREIRFGEFEGKTIDFTDLTFLKARRAHKLQSGQVESIYHFPGMENWAEVALRTTDFLREILEKHRGEHIVIVTHADPLLTIKHFFNGEEPTKLTHQPYPVFAQPIQFFWDHDTEREMDLHKENTDDIAWASAPSKKHSVDALLVRHGETDWNKAHKLQGSEIDLPLNETGRNQLEELGKKLKGKKFDAIVSSPLLRAHESAEILSKALGIPLDEPMDLLKERSLGEWCSLTRDAYFERYPHGRESEPCIALSPHSPPKGETLSQFLKRMQDAHRELLRLYAGKKILIVAHGGVTEGLRVVTGDLTYAKGSRLVPNGEPIPLQFHPLLERIPDVLDCWFESGAMPYAQSHFPFANDQRSTINDQRSELSLPPGFPANFIAEGIDQTRGWFYTLTVLSAALFKSPAFQHCIVNGTVLAEDGKKMSKRLKNYPEPLVVVEKHGADAVRFMLMSSPAVRGEDMRFTEKGVEEALRSVILPLWNTYAFFVTYANAAEWSPTESRRTSRHSLDQWILAETQDLVNRMTDQLESYDLSATCAELHDSIDALTNWYVRLSRRRFAGKSALTGASALEELNMTNEQEQRDALATLYDVLLTLTQLLAPFCPFVTDAMYLNLVGEEHGSIHLTDWPKRRELTEEERLMLRKTRLLRTVVSLGLKIRSEKKIKIRQPLAKALVAIPASLRKETPITSAEIRLLEEELNVKTVELVDDPGSLAQAIVLVDARKVGPRLGGRVQELIQAGKRGDFEIRPDGGILIMEEVLTPEEASLVYRGTGSEDVASDHGIVISMDTTVSEELQAEGAARDLIRAIQQLRKEAGYDISDTVEVGIDDACKTILSAHGDLIAQETSIVWGTPEGEEHRVDVGEWGEISIFLKRKHKN